MEWTDLQTILAVVDNGGLQGGAKALGVHPTTVSRRVRTLEAGQGVALFERFRHGVELTEAGADAIAVARELRSRVDDLSTRLQGLDTRLSGAVRLTSVDSILRLWMPHFAKFRVRYPDIELELSSGMDMANLTQREADVAVRIAGQAPGHLIGSRLCSVAHSVYVSDALFREHGASTDRGVYPWVSYDLARFRGIDRFLAARHPQAQVVMRVPRIDLLVAALRAGVGVSILNCHVGDSTPGLRRVGPADAGVSQLWVLTHPELRGAARVSAFMRFVREVVAEEKDLFEGRRPRPGSA